MTQHPPRNGAPAGSFLDRMADETIKGTTPAWAVHAFTASGVVLALLALLAVERGAFNEALLWLFAALVVDGVDGSFARAAKVKGRLPRIDGDALDLVIDYLTYVLVPALFIWRGAYLPDSLAFPLVAGILVSSLYTFARRDMKTDDGYFRGFPALWNVIAFYLFVSQPIALVSAFAVGVLILMTFAPVHVIHPFRARDYAWWPKVLAVLWLLSTAALLLPSGGLRTLLLITSLSSAALLIGMGLLRTVRGPKAPQ